MAIDGGQFGRSSGGAGGFNGDGSGGAGSGLQFGGGGAGGGQQGVANGEGGGGNGGNGGAPAQPGATGLAPHKHRFNESGGFGGEDLPPGGRLGNSEVVIAIDLT